MKLVSLLALLVLTVACGKDSGSNGSQMAQEESCSLNGRAVACASIQGADGQGIDLLESMVDVNVRVTDSEIQFLNAKTASSQGRRINCKTEVKNGESYRYSLSGNTLRVMTSKGTYNMERLTDGSSIVGTWAWRGHEDNGILYIRQISFLNETRAILRTSCEL